jgi:large subunit ribosomal protein L24e
MIELGRIPRRTTWTRAAKKEKDIALAAAAPKAEAPAAPVEEKAKKTTASKPRAKKQAAPKPKKE